MSHRGKTLLMIRHLRTPEEEEAVERITAEVIKDIETEAEIEKLEDDAKAKREEVRKAPPSKRKSRKLE